MKSMHGAVIVKGNSVLSVGINKFRNDPTIIESNKILQHCSVHAEVDALSRAGNPKGATMYIARINKQGVERMSRPCNNCYRSILDSGISKIIFTIGEE